MKRSLVLSVAVAAITPLMTSCFLIKTRKPEAVVTKVPVPTGDSQEARIFNGVNAYRASKGKPALRREPGLDAMARAHSADMMRNRRKKLISHDGYQARIFQARQQFGYQLLSENVGVGSGSGASQGVISLWSDSRPHRTAMLGSWDASGVGTVTDSDGMVFVTQLFGKR